MRGAGALNQRISIERKVELRDDTGQPKPVWSHLMTLWAEKLEPRAREQLASGQPVTHHSVLFRVRWREDIDETDRLVHRGQRYHIDGLTELGRQRLLTIQCHRYKRGD